MANGLTYRDLRSNAVQIADEQIKEQVLSGIQLLNEQYGPDWVDHIDPRKLSLSSASFCVLGQLYDPATAFEQLGWMDDPKKYGFLTYEKQSFLDLTNGWRKALGLPEVAEEPSLP